MSAAIAIAGEAPPPVLLHLADGADLLRHAEESLYGRLWRDPVCDPLRDRMSRLLGPVERSLGATLPDALTAVKGPALRIDGFAADADGVALPQAALRIDVGEFAERLLVAIASRHEAVTDAGVPGALDSFVPFAGVPVILGRFGSVVVGSFGAPPDRVQAWPAPAPVADLHLAVDLPRLAASFRSVVPTLDLFGHDALADLRGFAGQRIDLRVTLGPAGIRETMTIEPCRAGLRAVDRARLARLPAQALAVCAVGIEGAAWWRVNREEVLAGLGAQVGTGDVAATARWIDESFAAWGLSMGLDEVVAGLDGTVLVAVTPGVPMPGLVLMVPRSAIIDRLMRAVLAQWRVAVPEPGQVAHLPIADLPLPLQVAVDGDTWLVTSDVVFAAGWSQGQGGGWHEGVPGRAALAQARADAVLIGASDTPAVLRALIQVAQPVLSVGTDLQRQELQAVLLAMVRLAGMASTGWLVAHPTERGMVIEDQGLIGVGSLAALGVAGVAAGLDMTRRAQHDETPVVDVLRQQILPAELRFQAARHIDQDGDGIGEFGLMDELAGVRPTGRVAAGTVTLLPRDLIEGRHGYQYFVYLPAADGGTVAEPERKDEARPADAVAARLQQRYFVAYAWPDDPEAGERIFAITPDGRVYAAPHTGGIPAWNLLYGGKGWDAKPVWSEWKPAKAGRDR